MKDIDKKLNENVNEEINLYDFRDKMNQNDLINLINDKNSKLITMISLTNLADGVKKSYKSDKCKADIRQDDEYKLDLEFENFNDYDLSLIHIFFGKFWKKKDLKKSNLME